MSISVMYRLLVWMFMCKYSAGKSGKITERETCLTWTIQNKALILLCKSHSFEFPVYINGPKGQKIGNCTSQSNKPTCSSSETVLIKQTAKGSEINITVLNTYDFDGIWGCSHGAGHANVTVSTNEGIRDAVDIQLVGSLKENNRTYIMTLLCSSCWVTLGCTAEFLVEHKSVGSLKYEDGKCFDSNGGSSLDMCSCGFRNEFIWKYESIDKDDRQTFSCHLKVKDPLIGSVLSKYSTITFNGSDFIPKGTRTEILIPPVGYTTDKPNILDDTHKDEIGKHFGMWIGIGVPAALILSCLACILAKSCRKRRLDKKDKQDDLPLLSKGAQNLKEVSDLTDDSSAAEKNYYHRLTAYVTAIVPDVMREYFKIKILKEELLENYLNIRKHDIYHLWMHWCCCQCTTDLRNFQQTISRTQFFSLYKDNKQYPQCLKTGYVQGKGFACICKISAKPDINLTCLDTTLIYCLLKTSKTLEPGVHLLIETLQKQRNEIFNHADSTSLSKGEFERYWQIMSESVGGLVDLISNNFKEKIKERQSKLLQRVFVTADILAQEKLLREYYRTKLAEYEEKNSQSIISGTQDLKEDFALADDNSTTRNSYYYRLAAYVKDIAPDVMREYFKIKILKDELFETYLNRKKHEICHLWVQLKCCQCIIDLRTVRPILSRTQFFSLYNDANQYCSNIGRIQRNRFICICKYSAKPDINLTSLDITLIHCLLKNLETLDRDVDLWIDTLRIQRNEIFNYADSKSLSKNEFERHWQILSGAVGGLVNLISNDFKEKTKKRQCELLKLVFVSGDILAQEKLLRDYYQSKLEEYEERNSLGAPEVVKEESDLAGAQVVKEESDLADQAHARDNYLRLLIYVTEIAADVMREYFRRIILKEESFESYLNTRKHDIFHVFQTSDCCQCINTTPKSKTRKLYSSQFFSLYAIEDKAFKCLQGSQSLGKRCICSIKAKAQTLVSLDITLIYFILKDCETLGHTDDLWMAEIRQQKHMLLHYGDSKSFSQEEFEMQWKKLSESVEGLANRIDEEYFEEVKERSRLLRKNVFVSQDLVSKEKLLLEYVQSRTKECETIRQEAMRPLSQIVDDIVLESKDDEKTHVKTSYLVKKIEVLNTTVDRLALCVSGNVGGTRKFTLKEDPISESKTFPVLLNVNVPEEWDTKRVINSLDHLEEITLDDPSFRIKSYTFGDPNVLVEVLRKVMKETNSMQFEIINLVKDILREPDMNTDIDTD